MTAYLRAFLGGGLSKAGRHLLEAVGPRLEALLAPLRPPPPVALAAHGDLSGVVGAALHAGLSTNRSTQGLHSRL